MDNEKLLELTAEVHGLRQVLAMVINSMEEQHADLIQRFNSVEEEMRKQNMLAGTIEVVRSYRMLLENARR